MIIEATIEIEGDIENITAEEASNILQTVIDTGCESYHLDGKILGLEIISL